MGLFSKIFKKESDYSSAASYSRSKGTGYDDDVVPSQYRVRPDDPELSLPFRISKFIDYGGTRDKRLINTMAYIGTFLYNARSEWFPKLSEFQPVPRGLPIKSQVSAVGRLVYEKGINSEVFRAFLDRSDNLDELIRYLEQTQNRRTLYSRKQ